MSKEQAGLAQDCFPHQRDWGQYMCVLLSVPWLCLPTSVSCCSRFWEQATLLTDMQKRQSCWVEEAPLNSIWVVSAHQDPKRDANTPAVGELGKRRVSQGAGCLWKTVDAEGGTAAVVPTRQQQRRRARTKDLWSNFVLLSSMSYLTHQKECVRYFFCML